MTTMIAPSEDTASGWERALYAFLAEKEWRTGSLCTVEGYSRMLQHFFGPLGKPPDQVTNQDTIGARIAFLSSFCRSLMRMGLL